MRIWSLLFAKLLFALTVVLLAFNGETGASSFADEIHERIRNRIEMAGIPARIIAGDDFLYAAYSLPLFYERRGYFPAWIKSGGPNSNADSLIACLALANDEGLKGSDYHLDEIRTLYSSIRGKKFDKQKMYDRLIDLELLLTDAFMVYATHLLRGKVNPKTIDPEWNANPRERDMPQLLEQALQQQSVRKTLCNILPQSEGYERLKSALKEYEDIARDGGWEKIPEGSSLMVGDRDDRVPILRRHLFLTNDIRSAGRENADLFDSTLYEAVRKFQIRHGLDIDGKIGPKTLDALNVPVEERIQQIKINLERWRWLPEDLGDPYIIINVANFELDLIEDNHNILTMRAIVGRSYRRTPVFSDRITYLVLNPYWHVPQNIAVLDILPKIKSDPEYLTENGFRVFSDYGAESVELDPLAINWDDVTRTNFKYRLRQDPGPKNLLGRIKFMFPNEYNVYLHDTPARDLFQKSARDFSSGCIRIEKPLLLAEYLLKSDESWNDEKLVEALKNNIEQTVVLKEKMPIHILYWTAWATDDGTINFRNDIYGRDRALIDAMLERPPEPEGK